MTFFPRTMKAIGSQAIHFWVRLNELAQEVFKNRVHSVGYPLLLSRGASGITISLAPGTRDLPIRVKVKAIGDDWLRCVFFPHDSADATDLYVRKPIDLMRQDLGTAADKAGFTWVDAQTRTEDATSQTHEVWPPYVVDGEISICPQIGGTGLEDPDGNPVIFVDMNLDARSWTLEC